MGSDSDEIFFRNRINALEQERKRLSDTIELHQKELEKVEFALKAFNHPNLTDNHGVELVLTEGGSLKNVHETLIGVC